uniref:Uncharacterized protein n=1 Tax=Marseillevirus LCMAC102 TaxID=2506603 RepID=A0A481YU75_9VIRU|nr:MAG: hypothetical protein LCMAC102_02360 [Marseillevirus LCMAC102]
MGGQRIACIIFIIVLIFIVTFILKRKLRPSSIILEQNIKHVSSFVINRKELRSKLLPEHQLYGVFNPSIIYRPHNKDYVILFRVSSFVSCSDNINLSPPYHGVIYQGILDEKNRVSNLKLVDLPYETMKYCTGGDPQPNNGVEDPRVFLFRKELWVAANANGNRKKFPCVPLMCIWKMSDSRNTFRYLKTPKSLGSDNQSQKNWAPFEWNGMLLFEYSVNPHIILRANIENGETYIFCKSENTTKPTLSGGGAAITVYIGKRKYFLNIAHLWLPVSDWLEMFKSYYNEGRLYNRDYYHYFYLFEAEPPFRIVFMSDAFKIAGGNEKVQFAGGCTYNSDQNKIVISYGKKDCDTAFAFYDIKDILISDKVLS